MQAGNSVLVILLILEGSLYNSFFVHLYLVRMNS